MRLSNLLRVVSGRGRARGPRRPSFRPGLTALEGRALLTTFMVTNTSGDRNVAGSLPYAVFQANYFSPGLDYIKFNLSGPSPHVINITDTLYINSQMVIDGKSQPDYSVLGSPTVSIRGNSSVASIFLLQADGGTTSSGSTIQGLDLANYKDGNAVTINTASHSNYVQENWIGFYLDSSKNPHLTSDTPAFSNSSGVSVESSSNTVRFNTISGVYNGIIMGGSNCTGNSIQGNNIGTDYTSSFSAGYGNKSDGIFLGAGGVKNNFLGPDNVLSGNASSGAEILDPNATGNVIFRNRIGTNYFGNAPIPNGELGVLIANNASGNTIGGPFGGNVISGNGLGGISLGTDAFPGASGNYIQYNIIGLNGDQTAVVGSQMVGIAIGPGATSNTIQSNVVAGQTVNGIVVSNSSGNQIYYNWIGLAATPAGQPANGKPFANKNFAIALLSGANYNRIYVNAFRFGTYENYIDPNAIGNQYN